MSKIIKKQIKRSMPAVLIFVLISTMVMGIAFNLDVKLSQLPKELGSKIKLGFNLPIAEAAKNFATTTVTVRNAPPAFTVNAAESPASTSTSPVNEGGSISFNGTGTDPEGQQYYLIICSTNAVTPHNSAAPTCNVTTYCTSGATNSGTQASCTYSNVSAALPENTSWYAFVCDAHPTEADCNATGNQGSGDSGSPFFVNHKPTINSVSTTDNNKNPGQTFTMTATTTDTDSQGGYDVIQIDFCKTNSWATSTGCTNPADAICTATTTSTGAAVAASCVSTSTLAAIPTPHGSYTYYAFAKDWHQLAPSTNGVSATYSVNDVSPVLGTVTLNGGADITLNIRGATQVSASTTVTVTDNNGYQDIVGATSSIFMATVSGGQYCTADNNYCYQITSGGCATSSGSGAVETITCSTTLTYYAHPSDNMPNNTASTTNWLGAIRVYDGSFSTTSVSGTGVEVISGAALDVSETSIPYGTIRSSFNSGTNNATTTIINAGNTPLNTNLDGTDMFKGTDVIWVTEQKWNLTNFDYNSAGTNLASTSQALAAIQVPKVTGADLSSPIYWGIKIEAGQISGVYTGTNTFYALLYSGVAW